MAYTTKNQSGVTLIELLVYLGLSSLIVLAMAGFLTRLATQRTTLADKALVEQSARTVLSRMTYAVRNAYDVVVYNDGTAVDIYSKNYSDPARPIVTTFLSDNGQLLYGQAENNPPGTSELLPVTDSQVSVAQLGFQRVSAAVVVDVTFVKNGRAIPLHSTIAFRQK